MPRQDCNSVSEKPIQIDWKIFRLVIRFIREREKNSDKKSKTRVVDRQTDRQTLMIFSAGFDHNTSK